MSAAYVNDSVLGVNEDWYNLKRGLEQKEKRELIEIIASLWKELSDKQKELNHLYSQHLRPPPQLLEHMDSFLDECDNLSPPLIELENPETKEEIEQKIPPMEVPINFNIPSINESNEYPIFHPALDEKSSFVQERISRLHLLSKQSALSLDITPSPEEQKVGHEFILTPTKLLKPSASMHRMDSNGSADAVLEELQLKTDCYECGAVLTRMLDPVNANEGIGIVCDGCGRSREDLKPSDFYYRCTMCESVNLCIICIARR